ncbi:MAG: hypothetical protein F6K37_42910 [Moorea sp. SIO4E2]|uniref:hypothetical protein n=1 Tax=Moorena sp. SIO4E2 TaxID=2607826 RepID=UPI0013B5E394|nr:hypothetical protein [Moorena sp. SIO4E2]NEQ12346.1 hypothetical protein [Moorena sp. SIO4E2]
MISSKGYRFAIDRRSRYAIDLWSRYANALNKNIPYLPISRLPTPYSRLPTP